MREDEEFCKKSFNNYLVNNLSQQPMNWRKGKNPPDYYFTLNREDYAVEVTTIMQKVIYDSKPMPQESFHSAIDDLIEEIREEAKIQGFLSGNYVIPFFGPFDNFKKARKIIKKAALKYIKNTKTKDKAGTELLYQERSRKCDITKVGNASNVISHGITSPHYGRWEGEAELEACELLNERIRNKMRTLKNIEIPIILLLCNKYAFSKPLIFRKCKFNLDILKFYHSIYIVDLKGTGYLVYSKEKSWL